MKTSFEFFTGFCVIALVCLLCAGFLMVPTLAVYALTGSTIGAAVIGAVTVIAAIGAALGSHNI